MTAEHPEIRLDRVDAVIFDTDGVVTDTARTHAAAWKRMFDEFFRRRSRQDGGDLPPFDVREDYLRYVDGRSRLDGVRELLASRGITVPEGRPAADDSDSTADRPDADRPDGDGERPDPSGDLAEDASGDLAGDASEDEETDTLQSLADRKNGYFLEELDRSGVAAFPSTVGFVRDLRRRGVSTAAVSASRNCARVLAAAHVQAMFDLRVDGVDVARLRLPGKPDPALFLEAARRLGVSPLRAAVVEDATPGVEAAWRGGFGLVIGIDRSGEQEKELYQHGAHLVVRDLAALTVVGRRRARVVARL